MKNKVQTVKLKRKEIRCFNFCKHLTGIMIGNLIDSRKIKEAKNIVIYGAQDFFNDNYKNLIKSIHPQYIFTNGGIVEGEILGLKVIDSIEKIQLLESPFVLIAIGNEHGIRFASTLLRKKNIMFDHLAFYNNSNVFSLKYLKAMDCWEYIDLMSNHYIIDKNTSSKIVIYRRKDLAYNNELCLKNLAVSKELRISLWGRNSRLVLQNSSVVEAKMEITTNGSIIFGDDCMISFDVFLGQADQHHIFDKQTHKRINYSKGIVVGNHVWVGKSCQLFDGTRISDGSIVAAGAITSHNFTEKNVILAGVPAKVIRNNVIWTRDEEGYDFETLEECKDKNALQYL